MQNRATAFLLQCKFDGKHPPRFSLLIAATGSRDTSTDLNEFRSPYLD